MPQKPVANESPLVEAPPPAAPGTRRTGGSLPPSPTTPPRLIRRYPTPPPLLKRTLVLVFRPETWAEAARYPFRVTMAPLLLTILLVAAVMAVYQGSRALHFARDFAAGYDAAYPAMEFKDGKLTALPAEGKEPVRVLVADMPFYMDPMLVVVDPTGKVSADSIPYTNALVVNDSAVVFKKLNRVSGRDQLNTQALADYRFPDGAINGTTLQAAVASHGSLIAGFAGSATFAYFFLKELLWAAAMTFLTAPLVMFGAHHLTMPKRVAYRIAAAVQIPLIVLAATLHLAGVGPARLMPGDWAVVLWGVATAALAFWAGMLANSVYAVKQAPRRGS